MNDTKGALTAYIQTRRGVGHTTLMKEGVKHYDKPFFVLGANIQHAKELMNGVDNENAIPLGLHSMVNNHKLQGVDYPMIIDAFTVQMVCEEYEGKIRKLRHDHYKEMHKREQTFIDHKIALNKDLSWALSTIKHREKRNRELLKRLDIADRRNNRMINYVIGVNKKVKAKFLGMSLFNRIFRYNKALDKIENN